MASGRAGGGFWGGRGGGGRTSGGGAGRRYTAALSRRVNERYTAPSRSLRRGTGGSTAIPSRWLR